MKSMKRIMLIMAVAVALAFGSLNSTAQIIVKVKPVAPTPTVVIRPNPPQSHMVWVDGHWKWSNKLGRYVWVDGYWVKAKHGHVWVSGHWADVPGGYKWVPGHWRRI